MQEVTARGDENMSEVEVEESAKSEAADSDQLEAKLEAGICQKMHENSKKITSTETPRSASRNTWATR